MAGVGKDCGVKFRSFHMTLGQCDAIASVEAPNDEAVGAGTLALPGSLGFGATAAVLPPSGCESITIALVR